MKSEVICLDFRWSSVVSLLSVIDALPRWRPILTVRTEEVETCRENPFRVRTSREDSTYYIEELQYSRLAIPTTAHIIELIIGTRQRRISTDFQMNAALLGMLNDANLSLLLD